MIIFPAIDIKGGKCVRLLKGDFSKVKKYEKSPLEQASEFVCLGFQNIHIIDLDGALKANLTNVNIIKEISKINKIKIQTGGGIRTFDDIKKLIDFGINKVILGTAAIQNIKFLEEACDKFTNKIAISIDVRDKRLALSGWANQTNILATDFIKEIKNINVSRIIYTDINKDGTKTGSSIEETLNFANMAKIPTVISGGVSSINEITDIKKKTFPI